MKKTYFQRLLLLFLLSMSSMLAQQANIGFMKFEKEILEKSNEESFWPQGIGIAVVASLFETFNYAPDEIDFMSDKLNAKVKELAVAQGAYRPDLLQLVVVADG